MKRAFHSLLLPVAASLLLAPLGSQAQYTQTNLVSNQPGVALTTDPNLVNTWGLSSAPGGAWWVSDAGTGLSTLYNGAGATQALVVTVPGGGPPSKPTGQVFNGTAADFGGAHFLFVTENGTLSAWTAGTSAVLKVDNSSSGAVYKGLALDNTAGADRVYAANFHSGKIDVFDSNFQAVTLGASAFTDPSLPAGYAPFNIQTIGTKLYVTYAVQDANGLNDVRGAGNGLVDVYDSNGNLLQRLATGSSAGGLVTQLNSPWGVALAPSNFGQFSNDILVGNFGDGHISAFDPTSGAFAGQLTDGNGNTIAIPGLWALEPGTGGNNGPVNDIFFTAGPNRGTSGLFGTLAVATPEPSAWAGGLIGLGSLLAFARRRRKK